MFISAARRNRKTARSRRHLSTPRTLERLEDRTLLSGLTIITHGAQFFSSSRPGWIDSMANAIRGRTGSSTAIYALRIAPNGHGGVAETNFQRIAGPSPTGTNSTNGETVLLLDWAAAAGVDLFPISSDYSSTAIAQAAIPYLTTSNPGIGLDAPLVEGAIQMIGHSRGASVISELAKLLGQRGLWVDQLTFLDPAPVTPDPGVSIKSNVIFADNYYQTAASLARGRSISGAYNVGPLKLGGAYGVLDGAQHSDVHLFYHGTINLAANAGDGSKNVKASWYTSSNQGRGSTGFYYSRLVGGARPLSGIGKSFGGNGSRSSITHSGDQWANLAMISLPDTVIPPNEQFTIDYKYNSFGAAADVTWYLDPDTNPYNGNSILLSSSALAATSDAPVNKKATFTITATDGTYYLEGRIVGEAGTRYTYSSEFSLTNRPPTGTVDPVSGTSFKGWAVDPDAESTPLSVRLDVDGLTFATQTANLTRSELSKTYASSAHGFSFDLSSLSVGIHQLDVYAYDTTDGTPTLISSITLYNNQAPIGKFSSFNGSVITGWAFDGDAGATPIQIQYTIDNGAPTAVTADDPRPDLASQLNSANHGFAINLPQLKTGKHTVRVYAIDPDTNALTLLGTRTATVKGPTGNKLPKGALETATTTLVKGWAFDGNTPKTSINVRIDIDGVAGVPFLAANSRPDLKKSLGASNFGYSQALTLTPGEHRIDVYAIDPGTGTLVLLGSKIVGTAPAESSAGALETVDSTEITGWAYNASLPPDQAPLIRIDIDGLIGTPFTADILRGDINVIYSTTGKLGFSIDTPPLASGTHTVKLNIVNPLTLQVTQLVSTTFVVA